MAIFTQLNNLFKRGAKSIQDSNARPEKKRCLQAATRSLLVGAATLSATFAQQQPLRERIGSLVASNAQIETVTVELTPIGFIPAEVTVTGPSFFLKVRSSFLRSVPLEGISKVEHKAVLHLKSGGRKKQEAGRFTLTPGQYSLAVADNPEWKLTITVEPGR